jgi:hypothetical protein
LTIKNRPVQHLSTPGQIGISPGGGGGFSIDLCNNVINKLRFLVRQ